MINVHRIPVEMVDRVSTHLVRLMKGLRANVFWVGLVTPVPKVVILLLTMAVLIILFSRCIFLIGIDAKFQIYFLAESETETTTSKTTSSTDSGS